MTAQKISDDLTLISVKVFSLFTALSFIFSSSSAMATVPAELPSAQNLKVMIDPGHGGNDTGATYEKTRESQLVLILAQKIALQLKKKSSFDAQLTRTEERYMNLEKRVQKAETENAQLFISLHANAEPESTASGYEMFVFPPNRKTPFMLKPTKPAITADHTTENKAAKAATHKALSLERETIIGLVRSDLEMQTRFFKSLKSAQEVSQILPGAIKPGDFFVLRKLKIPALLFEVGFLSNARDRARLLKESYQDELAEKMADAIIAASVRLGLTDVTLQKIE